MEVVNIDMNELRRFNLQELIDTKYGGVQANLLKDTKLNQGELSGILNGKRPLGERKARNIEIEIGLPDRWLERKNENFFQNRQNGFINQAENAGNGTQNNLLGNTISHLNNTVANGGTQYNVQMPPNGKNNTLDLSAVKDKLIKAMPLLDIDQAIIYATTPDLNAVQIKENIQVATFVPHSGRTFGLKMPDDSMLAPEIDAEAIFKNDLLIIEPLIEPRDGDLVLVCLDSEHKKRGIVARLELDVLGNSQLIQVGRGKVAAPMPENALICGVVIEIKRRLVSLDVLESRLQSFQTS